MSTPQKEQHEAAEADGRDISPDAFQAEPDGIDLAAHQRPADAPKPEVPPPEDDPLNLENSRVPENYRTSAVRIRSPAINIYKTSTYIISTKFSFCLKWRKNGLCWSP